RAHRQYRFCTAGLRARLGRMSASAYCSRDTATTEIYTLSLHDALPISGGGRCRGGPEAWARCPGGGHAPGRPRGGRGPCPCPVRSEEHTSELQSRENLVCRLLLEKKNKERSCSWTGTPSTPRRSSRSPR